jgi:DNA repair protein RecO (recombination protein O)
LSETARYTIQYINSAPLGGLYNFSVTDEVTEEIQRVTKQFMDVYVDKKFKAADIIDSLQ